ncbi:MAG: hypothetical protein AB7N24_07075 [Dehalococcoidia bacterium]
MSRIRPLSQDEAHEDARAAYDQDMRAFGLVLNPTGVLAYRPPVLAAARALGASVGKGGVLEPELRTLVCVRVASLVGCPF